MRMVTVVAFVLSIVPSALSQAIQVPVPQHQSTPKARSGAMSASLVSGSSPAVVSISRNGRVVQEIVLPSASRVTQLHFAALGKLVVFAGSNVHEVVIASEGKVTDYFLCYNPSISPTGNLIVFTEFFPAHFVEGASAEYALYDVRKSAVANRPSSVAANDLTTVGTIFYPVGKKNRPLGNVGLPADQIHSMASEGSFWTPSGNAVAFADKFQDRSSLIIAYVDEVTDAVKAFQFTLNNEQVCGSPTCTIDVTAIHFSPDGSKVFAAVMGQEHELTFSTHLFHAAQPR